MQIPGPKDTCTPKVLASSPNALPTSSAPAMSQELATVPDVGKQVAGLEAPRPKWSPDLV